MVEQHNTDVRSFTYAVIPNGPYRPLAVPNGNDDCNINSAPCPLRWKPPCGWTINIEDDVLPNQACNLHGVRCTYTDSEEKVHTLVVHFPPALYRGGGIAGWQHGNDRWPVFVYIHGNKGENTNFFSNLGRRRQEQPGVHFAREHFIVVSPSCHWPWTSVPMMWPLEAVDNLRTAHWVDPTRMYLAGHSMGGMNALELAAHDQGLFAAIAVASGYHKPERRDQLARALRGRPIIEIASRHDSTCPWNKQLPLWQKLATEGAAVDLLESHHTDHGKVFDTAFLDTLDVYRFLLHHKLLEDKYMRIRRGGAYCVYIVNELTGEIHWA